MILIIRIIIKRVRGSKREDNLQRKKKHEIKIIILKFWEKRNNFLNYRINY